LLNRWSPFYCLYNNHSKHYFKYPWK
jgi:hypothetical protein